MIESGDTGIDGALFERFLELLPLLEPLGIFPDRFTLELRIHHRETRHFHVNRKRGVVRPVVAEDSRKTLVSIPQSHFKRLVETGELEHWKHALSAGDIKVRH